METVIYENGTPIGKLRIRDGGLFWIFSCELEKMSELPRRIFVISGYGSEYLGIPNRHGELNARLAKRHFAEEITCAVADANPRGEWKPWRGEADGVAVGQAYLQQGEDGMLLALPAAETVKFPAWAEYLQTERVFGTPMAALKLDAQGHLPLIEKENEDTTYEETDFDNTDFLLPSDAAAADGERQDGREADSPDL